MNLFRNFVLAVFLLGSAADVFADGGAGAPGPAAAASEASETESKFSGGFGYQTNRIGTRIYFDTSSDDEGEIDIFEDGKFSLNYAPISFLWNQVEDNYAWGPVVSVGIATASDSDSDALVFVWSAGMELELTSEQLALELGYIQGISSDESLNSSTRDDGAIFIGVSLKTEKWGKKVGFKKLKK